MVDPRFGRVDGLTRGQRDRCGGEIGDRAWVRIGHRYEEAALRPCPCQTSSLRVDECLASLLRCEHSQMLEQLVLLLLAAQPAQRASTASLFMCVLCEGVRR